ncbi:MAG: Hsp70 family protein, partial [Cyanobacteria bacterium P01_E01_bin.48]
VSFDIDANGILNISARDKGTNLEQSITISNTGGLSSTEVERMRQEAIAYSEEDLQRKQSADLRNQADMLLYSYQTSVTENAERLSLAFRERAADAEEAVRQLLANDTLKTESLQNAMVELDRILQEAGQALYGSGEG